MFNVVFSFLCIYSSTHLGDVCRVVKRSSYRLNCVILSAILMGFIGTALYTCEPDNDHNQVVAALVCNVRRNVPCVFYLKFLKQLRHWMTELAFMISFATFFMKMWRLYKLFFNENLSERVRQNIHFVCSFSQVTMFCRSTWMISTCCWQLQ